MINGKNDAIVGSEGCCHSEMNDGKDLERGGSSDIKVPCRESYLLMGAVYAGEYPGAKEEATSKNWNTATTKGCGAPAFAEKRPCIATRICPKAPICVK